EASRRHDRQPGALEDLAGRQGLDRAKPLPGHRAPQGQETLQSHHGQTERGDAMDQGPLVAEEIEAGARVLAEFQKSYPVQSAFWLKESDDGYWYHYVASERITDENFDRAYGEVVRIAMALQDPWLDTFKVKVIGADDPLAKAALELRRRYPGQTAA